MVRGKIFALFGAEPTLGERNLPGLTKCQVLMAVFTNLLQERDIMNKKTWVTMLGLCLLGLLLLAGCSKKENTNEEQGTSPTSESKPSQASAPIDSSTAAKVSGTVTFGGAAPKPAKIDMSQDAACKGTNQAETVVVDSGKLADQNGCRYHPHVLGVMAGQTIEIKNSDPTTHNIHPTPKDNREWNESQPPNAAPLEKTFAREEIMLPVKCNQHPWMKMFINVSKTPFYAVTGADGKYEIKGLPPGDYTLAFVHEKLGEQDQKVTLAAKDSKTVDQGFKQ